MGQNDSILFELHTFFFPSLNYLYHLSQLHEDTMFFIRDSLSFAQR